MYINTVYLKEQFKKLSKKHKIKLIEMEHDEDHIHILFEAKPETQLVPFIMGYKMQTSKGIKQLFPEIKQYLWKKSIFG